MIEIVLPKDAQARLRKRGRKYRNRSVTVDGIRFDSVGEAERWFQLRIMERKGYIRDLVRQPVYVLPGGIKYRADFSYVVQPGIVETTEDYKGVETAAFKLKAKLFREKFGRDIVIVRAK